jgi:two-component system, chemotaxis family, chemotaxis protein CheY
MKIVLIADDSPVVRKVGRRLLEDLGFVVVDASNTSDAVQICKDNMPDIVIIDRGMPGPDAIDAIADIKRMPGGMDIRILYALSEVIVSEMTKAKRAGADGFLIKPFDKSILERRLAEARVTLPNQQAA